MREVRNGAQGASRGSQGHAARSGPAFDTPRLPDYEGFALRAAATVAVLLAAGEGTRLYPYTHERPKCLVEVGGRPLLDRALAALEQAGVDEVVIVTGYREDVLAAWLAQRPHRLKVTLVRNELYASTNNAYSLWTARVAVPGAFVLLDGDLLFETRVLTTLLAASGEAALAVERRRELGDEEMKVLEAADGTVAAVSKTVEVAQAIGESVGLARFSAAAAQRLWARLGAQIEAGQTRVYYELAFEQLIADGLAFHISDVTGLSCMEIDTPTDLAAAHGLAADIDRRAAAPL